LLQIGDDQFGNSAVVGEEPHLLPSLFLRAFEFRASVLVAAAKAAGFSPAFALSPTNFDSWIDD
jgi:hypothetical protein